MGTRGGVRDLILELRRMRNSTQHEDKRLLKKEAGFGTGKTNMMTVEGEKTMDGINRIATLYADTTKDDSKT